MKIKNKLLISIRALLSSAIITTGTVGCTLPYLHSNETEILTQGAKEAVGNIKVDQNFANTKQQLASFATREDQAVADYVIASRDRQFASLVRNNVLEESKDTAIDRLQDFVNERFKKIIGRVPTDELANVIPTLPVDFSFNQERRKVSLSNYETALVAFIKETEGQGQADARPTDCAALVKLPDPKLPAPLAPADSAYDSLVLACKGIEKAENDESKNQLLLAPTGDSALSNVFNKSNKALTDIQKDEAQAIEINVLIDEIERLSKSVQPDQKKVSEKISKVQGILKNAKVFAKFANAKRISKALEEVLAANLDSTTTTDAKTKQYTAAILKLTDSLAEASDAFQDQPQIIRVNSVLVAITEQRQKRDMALLDISRQNDLLRIYEAEQAALIQELAQLSITQRILNKEKKNIALDGDGGDFAVIPPGAKKPGSAVGSMLAAYVASWNQGQIPYQILQFKEVQVERAYHVEVAAKTAQNRKDLLTPALDELAAYGKGGIHPETIATLITNIGLVAAFAAR